MSYIDKNSILDAIRKDASIYKKLSKELRKDPEILRLAIENCKDQWTSPLPYALPEAKTHENIFLAIDKGILTSVGLTKAMLSDRKIVEYFIVNVDASIYSEISSDLRKDPKILKLTLENWKKKYYTPIFYARPEALTYENVFLAIDKELLTRGFGFTKRMLSDKKIVEYFIKNKDANIYIDISLELRKDPEILRLALENAKNDFNPLWYASQAALTHENIFLAIDRGILTWDRFTTRMLSDRKIVKYFIENKDASIYWNLSEELRKDSSILMLVLKKAKSYQYHNLLLNALPSAITNDIIDWLISNNIFLETPTLLNNKYYVLKVAEKNPKILDKISAKLRKDSQVQKLKFMYDPKFLSVVGARSFEEYLKEYCDKYNLTSYTIQDFLNDDMFIQRVLKSVPQVYTLLFEEQQKMKKNIRAILKADGTNLIFVPIEYVTPDLVDLSKQSYGQLFEMLNDSSRILDVFNMMQNYEKIFAHVLYIFAVEQNLLDDFIEKLKNNDVVYKRMLDLIKKSPSLFNNFLGMIHCSNQSANIFFVDLLVKNNLLTAKKVRDVCNLWGPTDLSFKKIYKFIRGVIGIDVNGKKIKINLDCTCRHHNDATVEIGIKTGCNIKDPTDTPFMTGMKVASQGTIIIQIEGDTMFVYLPENISLEQNITMKKLLESCREFKHIAFACNDNFYDTPNIQVNMLESFCDNIVKKTNELGKTNTQ